MHPFPEDSADPDEQDAQIAGRLLAMASGPVSADTLRRALLWVVGEVQANGDAMRAATAQMAALAERVAEVESGGGVTGDGVNREVEFLWRETEAKTSAVSRTTDQLEATVRELSAYYGQVADRLGAMEQRVGDGVREQLDRVALEVSGTPDFAELARAALRSERVEDSVRALRAEVDQVSRTQAAGQQEALAHVAGRTAPLEGALHELRRELDAVADESAAAQEALRNDAFDRIVAVAERVQSLEALPRDVDGLLRELDRISGQLAESAEVTGTADSRVAALAEHVDTVEARLGAVDDRMAALASLTADVDGMYQQLDRVAELTQERDGTVARLADWATPVEVTVAGLRHEIEQLAAEVRAQQEALEDAGGRIEAMAQESQTVELDLRRRLGSVEPLAGELEGLYREIGRMAATANDCAERIVDLDATASTHGGSLDELRQRLDQARMGVEELSSGMSARLRTLEALPDDVSRLSDELDHLTVELGDTRQDAAARHGEVVETLSGLESVPVDIEGVYRALDRLAAELVEARTTSATGLEAAIVRITSLQALPADVEGLYRELDRLAEANRLRGEQLVEVEGRSASAEVVAELRAEVGRMAAEVRSEVDKAAVDLRTELDSLGDDVAGSKIESAARLEALAGVLQELERLPADVGALYRELERLDQVDRRRGEQIATLEGRIAPDEMTRLHAQIEAASLAVRGLETLPAEVEGLYRELDRLTELDRERGEQLAGIEGRTVAKEVIAQLESELDTMATELAGTAEGLQKRIRDLESVPAAVQELTAQLAEVRGRSESDRDALRTSITALEAIPADVEGVYRELHRIDEANRQADAQLADLEGRTVPREAVTNLRGDLDQLTAELGLLPSVIDEVRGDVEGTLAGLRRDLADLSSDAVAIRSEAVEAAIPLQSALADLRRDLDVLTEAASVAEADDVLAFEGLKDLDARLRAVESLPERVEKIFRELSRASGDVVSHQQAALDLAVAKVDELEDRLAAVESLPADLEGLYAALYRVAESVKALREDADRD